MPSTYLSPGVYVEEVPSASAPIAGVGTSTAGFIGVKGSQTSSESETTETETLAQNPLTATEEVKLCTNFGEFKKFFGDFSEDTNQNILAHAVYGFFRNGGTRCYVVQIDSEDNIDSALNEFEAIDEIAIVAAPGIISGRDKIKDHCANSGDRFAILDSVEEVDLSNAAQVKGLKPFDSDYAALYFPWIKVFDPATKQQIYVPPSGHMAGIYARVDKHRRLIKKQNNESVLGAEGLQLNNS